PVYRAATGASPPVNRLPASSPPMSVQQTISRRAASGRSPHNQEAVMGKAVPTHHPAVVLRSHYNALRALLAAALIAVVALTAPVVILADANDTDGGTAATRALPLSASNGVSQGGVRYDGGPEEGTRGPNAASPTPEQALRLRSQGMNELYGG